MTNSSIVYTGVDIIPQLEKYWMVSVEGGNPIKIIDNQLMFQDEAGNVRASFRELTQILQGQYKVYNHVAVGDWVKFDHPKYPQTIYGHITSIENGKHVAIKGYEGTRFPLEIMKKITTEKAWQARLAKVFEWNGRKPHEYKAGDIVRIPGYGGIHQIKNVLPDGDVNIYGSNKVFSKGKLTIISFIDNCVQIPSVVSVDQVGTPITAPTNKCCEILQPEPGFDPPQFNPYYKPHGGSN